MIALPRIYEVTRRYFTDPFFDVVGMFMENEDNRSVADALAPWLRQVTDTQTIKIDKNAHVSWKQYKI